MDGLGLTWPEYSSDENMVLFGNETGPALVVPGDYYNSVFQCDE